MVLWKPLFAPKVLPCQPGGEEHVVRSEEKQQLRPYLNDGEKGKLPSSVRLC